VAGLLRFHLGSSERERAAGVALLRHAQRLGVREPEMVRILNEQARIGRAHRTRWTGSCRCWTSTWRTSRSVRKSGSTCSPACPQYAKVRPLDRRPELISARVVAPTVAEMNDRSELLRERVTQLLTTEAGKDDLAAAQELVRVLANDSRVLVEHAHSVESKEADLLVLIGDSLLADEER